MTEHVLKTWQPYWEAVASGAKPFEVRRDDRGFQRGDILVLRCTEPKTGLPISAGPGFSAKAKEVRKRISYILTGGQLGIEPGYVVMGLQDVEIQEGADDASRPACDRA